MAIKDGKMRAVSNLSIPKEFMLPKGSKGKGFIGFYSGSTRRRYKELYSKMICHFFWQTLLPQTRQVTFIPGSTRRSKVDAMLESIKIKDHRDYATLRRYQRKSGQRGFLFECAVGKTNSLLDNQAAQQAVVDSLLNPDGVSGMSNGVPFEPITTARYTGQQAASFFLNLKPGIVQLVKDCVEEVSVVQHGSSDGSGGYIVYFSFFISEQESSALTCTPYPAIRLSNLYLMLLQWLQTLWGTQVKLPLASIPLTRIEESVKEAVVGRVVNKRNQRDNIIVTERGEYFWIPDVNQIARYEEALESFGLQADGAYTMRRQQEGPTVFHSDEKRELEQKRLPSNIPIFTDWVNSKFTYSQSTGIVNSFDMSRSVPMRAFHARDMLDSSYLDVIGQLSVLANIGATVNIKFDVVPSDEELVEAGIGELGTKSIKERLSQIYDTDARLEFLAGYGIKFPGNKELEGEYRVYEEVALKEFHSESRYPLLRCVGRWLDKMYTALQNETLRESVFRHYSVMTVCEAMAILTVAVKYGQPQNYAAVVAKDDQDRGVYKTQETLVGRPVEAVPNIRKGMAFLPHQAKAENKLQSSPKLAALQIDAGGGKSPVTLMSILAEMGRGTCQLPLIMCPGHLVANYVSEAVYFTEGKVNIIPCTGYTLRQNGLARLEKMIVSAPPNTILITDFDFIKGRAQKMVYGTRSTVIFRNAEWLRQFRIDLVFVDESHLLSNEKSIRTQAAHRILSEIPYKRIESGTMVKDTMLDLPSQMALLDPTILGSETKFRKRYAADEKGGKVTQWKPGAGRMIKEKMAEHCVVITAKRKEWAALLPPYDEEFHAVEMTPAQRELYMALLDETKEAIFAEAESNPRLKALLDKASQVNTDKALDDADDDEDVETLQILLKAHLSRLEQFITAPGRDKIGSKTLQGADRISPKVLKIYEICQNHFAQGIYGKILIFTTHLAIAEEIYEQMPPDLKAMTIHYTADRKLECGAMFENNPNMKIMVGGETTMNTGLNFQYVSRMIRMETVWTPGILEQGNARLNRPELKKKDLRDRIYFDWVFVNRTFDVTKISRLVAKNLQRAKFDEAYDQRYQDLPDLPMIKMSLENILYSNDFQEDMMPYLDAHEQLLGLQQNDYADYREKARKEGLLDENGKLIPVSVPDKGLLEGSKLMARTPYVPQMNLYGAADLGLVRYDEYMRLEAEQDLEEEDEKEDDDSDVDVEVEDTSDEEGPEDTTQRALNAQELEKAANLRVHTEFGDGYIQGVNKRTLVVLLDSGELVRPRKIATYVVTRADTNSKDIRNQLLKAAGQIPIDAPIDVPAASMRSPSLKAARRIEEERQSEQVKKALEQGIQVSLDWTFVADFLGLVCNDISNSTVVAALSQFGFTMSPELYMAKLRNAKDLYSVFKVWRENFDWPNYTNKRWGKMYTFLKTKQPTNFAGVATKVGIRNFFVLESKPSSKADLIKPYPVIKDGVLYLALPIRGQAGTMPAINATRNLVTWKKHGGDQMIKFVGSKPEAVAVLKKLLDGGVKITNLDELGKKFKKIKVDPRPMNSSSEDDE